MSASASAALTVTIRTRHGQVLDRELEAEEADEVRQALLQMVAVLFSLEQLEEVRSVTFSLGRQ